jgi:hypothetical protein
MTKKIYVLPSPHAHGWEHCCSGARLNSPKSSLRQITRLDNPSDRLVERQVEAEDVPKKEKHSVASLGKFIDCICQKY